MRIFFFCTEKKIPLSSVSVVEVDSIAHDLIMKKSIQKKIQNLFPAHFPDAEIRLWLRKKIYAHPPSLLQLEQILHPPMFDVLQSKIQFSRQQQTPLLVVCALPISFVLCSMCDSVIFLRVSRNTAWSRIQKRNPEMPKPFFDFIWERQSQEYKKPLAKNALLADNTNVFFPQTQ
jgi:dephospho-CoA kinase